MTAPRALGSRPPEEALVILLPCGVDEIVPGALSLIEAICASDRRLSVVVVVPRRDQAEAAARRFPVAFVHVAGWGLSLARLRSRALLRIEAPRAALPASLGWLLARARRRGIPAFGLTVDRAQALEHGNAERPLAPLSPVSADGLPERADTEAAAAHLISAMGFERGDGPALSAVARLAQRLVRGPLAGMCAPMVTRIADRDALSAHLGQPATIMCLGNGPTSADPRLRSMAHDALFRVNHQWMDAGYMSCPDLLFAGVKKSMRAAGRIPVAVASRRKEEALLGTRVLTPWHGPLRYVVIEEIADIDPAALHGHPRPTTGAVMMAAAIALQPARLIVAGMDLFSDAAGAYPGAPATVNAYTAAHDRDTDAAFIRTHLARYEGEIVTLSDAFADLAHSVAEGRFTLVSPGRA
ncbi:hypothetical protein ACSSV4_000764 [Roseovarius sp. MBR-154]|jgi:hypothetical protein